MSKLDILPQWSVVLLAGQNKKTPFPVLIKKMSSMSILKLSPEQIKEKIEESESNGQSELVVTHLEKAELIQLLLKKIRVKSDLKRCEEKETK